MGTRTSATMRTRTRLQTSRRSLWMRPLPCLCQTPRRRCGRPLPSPHPTFVSATLSQVVKTTPPPSDTETGHALKCRHCSSTFQDMKSLQIHSFLDHNTSESPPPYLQQQQQQLQQQQQPPQTFGCHICGAALPSQAAFHQHLQTHVHFRPYICSMPQCDAGFTSSTALEAHSRLHRDSVGQTRDAHTVQRETPPREPSAGYRDNPPNREAPRTTMPSSGDLLSHLR